MATRAYIEDSGVGSRWEFDKKILFGLVDHVTRISQDIADIAKVRTKRVISCHCWDWISIVCMISLAIFYSGILRIWKHVWLPAALKRCRSGGSWHHVKESLSSLECEFQFISHARRFIGFSYFCSIFWMSITTFLYPTTKTTGKRAWITSTNAWRL